MAAEWCYGVDGRDAGPVSASELRKLAQEGRVTPDTPIWKVGSSKKVPASRVRGLFPDDAVGSAAKPDRSERAPRPAGPRGRGAEPQENPAEGKERSTLLEHVEVSAGRVAEVTRFGVGAIVQGFRHINGHAVRHLHPQRYAMVCVAFFTLVGVMVEPLLRAEWTAPVLQALAFATMVPCLMVVLGDPSSRIPSNLRAMGLRWAAASFVAWIVIWQVLRFLGHGSWIPLGMMVASLALLGTVIEAPGGKSRREKGRKPRAGGGDQRPRPTAPSS